MKQVRPKNPLPNKKLFEKFFNCRNKKNLDFVFRYYYQYFLMDLRYIDENNTVGYDRGDAYLLEMLQKMKNSSTFSKPFVSSKQADIILGLEGFSHFNFLQ